MDNARRRKFRGTERRGVGGTGTCWGEADERRRGGDLGDLCGVFLGGLRAMVVQTKDGVSLMGRLELYRLYSTFSVGILVVLRSSFQ